VYNVCCAAACFSLGSLFSYTHESRAFALYCLLTQAIRSLMACEKQMSAAQPLVFLLDSLYHIRRGNTSTFIYETMYSGTVLKNNQPIPLCADWASYL
ncbi:MAG: hypothetical protein UCN44_09415, partial [Enterocloster sp.]|nr:hypothetical protein [Enterocloster sp.]